ncbi:MAG: DsrE/DsrF/DrsH-like family protein [Coprothermobacterota bacterium]|nr:DsrE/DsrF/DrsH-like family protein [Coprothermobacterota bacterium]
MIERKNRLAIIASKGTLDMAYPPLILATTAIAMEMEAGIFFTFYGLNIIRKDRKNKLFVAPIGNPAMPMPMPNILGMLPGMTSMGTMIMKGMMKKANAPSINELLEICRESGVRMIGCQMTMDAFGLKKEALIDGIEVGGAATFLAYAAEAAVSLFI